MSNFMGEKYTIYDATSGDVLTERERFDQDAIVGGNVLILRTFQHLVTTAGLYRSVESLSRRLALEFSAWEEGGPALRVYREITIAELDALCLELDPPIGLKGEASEVAMSQWESADGEVPREDWPQSDTGWSVDPLRQGE